MGHCWCILFVQSQGDFLLPCFNPLLHREIKRNGGGGEMSREVNTETGVWQGRMIRFINQPMLFSLLGDCCKTLSTNWLSQCPTTETLLAPSPFLVSKSSFPALSHIPSYLSSASLPPFPLFPSGAIRFTPSCPTKMDWPWKHPFCLHHHLCVFSSSVRGVSTFPPVSPDHWLAQNIQYFLQLEWNWAHYGWVC